MSIGLRDTVHRKRELCQKPWNRLLNTYQTQRIYFHRLSDYPILRKLLLYQPFRNQKFGKIAIFAIPLSVPVYLIGINQQKILKQDINKVVNVSKELITLLQKDNNDIE